MAHQLGQVDGPFTRGGYQWPGGYRQVQPMLRFTGTFLGDQSGATALEYGLVAALISVAAIIIAVA